MTHVQLINSNKTKQKHQNHYQNKSKTNNYATDKITTWNLIRD